MISTESRSIAVIGMGTMGHGIAQEFACAGFVTKCYDDSREALISAPKRINRNIAVFRQVELLNNDHMAGCLQNIRLYDRLEDACKGVELVIEAVPEDLALKQRIFASMEKVVSARAILATNTSGLSIGEIAQGLNNPERVVGTHYWNPPHVMPLVEVVKGPQTADRVFDLICALLAEVGKEPVRVLQDIPGFLGNRMQHALEREALALLEAGVASAEDIDKVVSSGFGLRMAIMGPLERADLGGLDNNLRLHEYLLPELERSTKPSPSLQKLVEAGNLGHKTGRGFYDWSDPSHMANVHHRDETLLKIIGLLAEMRKKAPKDGG